MTLYCFLQHAPGVPRILVGNRLHLAFKRQVPTEQARAYAEKNSMTFFEVSPLCNFNVIESFTELSRIVLMRHGMEKFWRPNRGELVTIFLFIFFLTRLGRKHVFCFVFLCVIVTQILPENGSCRCIAARFLLLLLRCE